MPSVLRGNVTAAWGRAVFSWRSACSTGPRTGQYVVYLVMNDNASWGRFCTNSTLLPPLVLGRCGRNNGDRSNPLVLGLVCSTAYQPDRTVTRSAPMF